MRYLKVSGEGRISTGHHVVEVGNFLEGGVGIGRGAVATDVLSGGT